MSSQHYEITSPPPVAAGHVRLVLLHNDTSYFFLEIPIDRILVLCLKPLKYLVFLGWCVLGSEGVLHHKDAEITTDGDLDSNGIYYYVTDDAFGGFFFRRRYFPAHVEVLTTWYLADKMLFVRWTPRLSSKGRIYHQRVPAVVQTSVVQYRNAMDIVYSLEMSPNTVKQCISFLMHGVLRCVSSFFALHESDVII